MPVVPDPDSFDQGYMSPTPSFLLPPGSSAWLGKLAAEHNASQAAQISSPQTTGTSGPEGAIFLFSIPLLLPLIVTAVAVWEYFQHPVSRIAALGAYIVFVVLGFWSVAVVKPRPIGRMLIMIYGVISWVGVIQRYDEGNDFRAYAITGTLAALFGWFVSGSINKKSVQDVRSVQKIQSNFQFAIILCFATIASILFSAAALAIYAKENIYTNVRSPYATVLQYTECALHPRLLRCAAKPLPVG